MLGKLGGNSANNAVLAGVAPNPVAYGGRPQAAGVRSADDAASTWTPWVLLAFVALWITWALLERHQKIRDQVQPKNVAINLRNLAAIVLPVILGLALLRVALVKAKLLIPFLPFGGDTLNSLLGALVRLVG